MTREELARENVENNIRLYQLDIKIEDLPWSGELIETILNDGTIEIVDRLVEFSLCSLFSFYYIDRYAWTMDPKRGPIPFKLFDFQKEALRDFQTFSKVIFRKSRQMGASVITGAYALWRANFQKAQIIKIISLTLKDAIELKEKIIDLNYDKMPGFLKSQATRDGKNVTTLKLSNRSKISVLAKSKNAGRGGTPSILIIDEGAFNEWMEDIWKSVEPSLAQGGDCIVISTTNGTGNWYHLTYTRAEQKLNEFHAIFIPWWRYPGRDNPWLQDILDGKIEDVPKFIAEKQQEQLNYTGDPQKAPWLWKRHANAKSEKEFQQEILAEFLGSGNTVIPSKHLVDMTKNIQEPLFQDRLPQEIVTHPYPDLWCWKDVDQNHLYTLIVDVAKGSAQDKSAFHVIDANDNEQVAEFNGFLSTKDYGKLIKEVAIYYNNAYVIIETSGLGISVFNEIYLHDTEPYQNVFVNQKGKALMSWETSTRTRPLLIDDLYNDIINNKTKIVSQRLLDELNVFIWSADGKAIAMQGYHDDLVMAFAIYCHLREYVLSSRPIGISNNRVSITNPLAEIHYMEIMNKVEKIESTYGISFEEYCWLNDLNIPEEYKKYLEEVR